MLSAGVGVLLACHMQCSLAVLAPPVIGAAGMPSSNSAAGEMSAPPQAPPPTKLSLPTILASSMTLAAKNATLWGLAAPSATVTMSLARAGPPSLKVTRSATVDDSGAWFIEVGSVPPSLHPATIELSDGTTTLTLTDVLLGTLLLCSGQSNMAITLGAFESYTGHCPGPNCENVSRILADSVQYSSQIRVMTVARAGMANPGPPAPVVPGVKSAAKRVWTGSFPEALPSFSAECWATGTALARSAGMENTPIGLIAAAESGSMIQSWMSPKAMASCPDAKLRHPPAFGGQGQWYNGLVAPLRLLRPDAIVWHQGEENADDAVDYKCFQKAMVSDWRLTFGLPALPYVFVQLQPCNIPPDQRYAQAATLELPATGMASCFDLGDPDVTNRNGLCHSRYKTECGRRLALEVVRLLKKRPKDFSVTATLVPDHTSRSKVSIELKSVHLGAGAHFNGTKQCSMCCGTEASRLATGSPTNTQGVMKVLVSSGTWKYVNAKDVRFLNGSLIVSGRWAPGWGVFAPLAVRYAWEDMPQCAIYNAEGLPLPPFNVTISTKSDDETFSKPRELFRRAPHVRSAQEDPLHAVGKANQIVHGQVLPRSGPAGPDLALECAMRSVGYDMSQRHPTAQRHAAEIHTSLQMHECGEHLGAAAVSPPAAASDELPPCADGSHWSLCRSSSPSATSTVLFVDCVKGSDAARGSKAAPFKTVYKAQAASREAGAGTKVFLRGGTCYLTSTLVLNELDSGVTWSSYDGERVVLSGGAPLPYNEIKWTVYKGKVMVAELPEQINASAVDSLFVVKKGDPAGPDAKRLVRARYPNGDSEVDRMPENYDKLGGGAGNVRSWEAAGNKSQRFPDIVRNSSFYPFFGHSNDLRWVLDWHVENGSSYFDPGTSFWRSSIGTGAKYNQTTFSKKVGSWTNIDDVVLHVIHYDWWGNWQWKLSELDTETQTMKFGAGGWQDAHGGPVAHNWFFAENVLQELDSPGEWYVDKHTRRIYYWPVNPSTRGTELVVSQLQTVLRVAGEQKTPAHDISVAGIVFAHTTTMYVAERYAVPSAGDWSVLSRGAVELDGVRNIFLRGCTWAQVGGNALSLAGAVHDSIVADGDFLKTGDSGIVSVGRLPTESPYDGTSPDAEFPFNVTVERCHFGVTGVFGKQTSALFIAVSKRIHFIDNVLYDGPRAGVNINDGFGGGHVVARNVIWNQLLESGDHGPVNTWSRTAYVQPTMPGTKKSDTPLIQEWTKIDNNFVMVGPKMGALYGPGDGPCSNGLPSGIRCPKGGGSMFTCLDHDDGSDYYLDTRNVCVFAGMKNYIGQNKIWDSNLIAYPDGALSQNRSGMACVWTSMNMGGDHSLLPCAYGRPTNWTLDRYCHNKEVYTNNTCVTHTKQAFEYDMFREDDLAEYGPTNTTMPFTARNEFHSSATFSFGPGWNHSDATAHGVDVGGSVHPEMDRDELARRARVLLMI